MSYSTIWSGASDAAGGGGSIAAAVMRHLIRSRRSITRECRTGEPEVRRLTLANRSRRLSYRCSTSTELNFHLRRRHNPCRLLRPAPFRELDLARLPPLMSERAAVRGLAGDVADETDPAGVE